MSTKSQRQLAELRARFRTKADKLPELAFLLKGSLLQRFKRCSSPGCACHADPPRLHGPYWQWTAKIKGKTVTRILSEQQVSRYREWMGNAQRFDQIVQELYELSAQADELLRSQEGAPRPPKRSARSRS